MNTEENRTQRRDTKRSKRRHGQRGGSGKRTKLIQDIWVQQSEKIKEQKRSNQQPTKP